MNKPRTSFCGNTGEREIFSKISRYLGCDVPELLNSLVQASNEKRMLYHGIRNPKDIASILDKGIMPITPEGDCSYWATGLALFHPEDNSPFFNFSGSHVMPDACELNLAIASHDLLSKEGIKADYNADSQLIIKENVPFRAFALVNVMLKHPEASEHQRLRSYRQQAEKLLLRAIILQLYSGFTPGKIAKYSGEIKNG